MLSQMTLKSPDHAHSLCFEIPPESVLKMEAKYSLNMFAVCVSVGTYSFAVVNFC